MPRGRPRARRFARGRRAVETLLTLIVRAVRADKNAAQSLDFMNLMSPTSPPPKRWLIACHWLGAALMCAALLAAELRHWAVDAALLPMRSVMVAHIGAGMALLLLTVPRLFARLLARRTAPAQPRITPAGRIAGAAHALLYALLIVEPLLGWLIVNAKGMRVPAPLLGVDFPALVGASADLVARLAPLHQTLARVFYLVIAAHVAAALWHHLIRRDDTLRRMAPWLRVRAPSAPRRRPTRA